MRKTYSRVLCLLLALCLSLTLALPAAAAEQETPAPLGAETIAQALHALDLFQGVGGDFQLDREMNRAEAITMMVRLLGAERLIYSREWEHPFTDVAEWAQEYVGYAYENGLTNGVSKTKFGNSEPVTAQMYVTYVLRALGYQDTASGTVWNRWKTLAESAKLFAYNPDLEHFTRADAVLISWAALHATMYSEDTTLLAQLEEQEVFTPMQRTVSEIVIGARTVTKESKLDEILAYLYAGALEEGTAPDIAHLNVVELQNTADYLQFYLGLERLYFTEGLTSEPMMTAQAHSVVIFRLQDVKDAPQVMADIKAGVNPNKWICVGVEPEHVYVEQVDDLILLVMDDDCGDAMVTAFRSLGKLTPDANGLYCVDGSYMEAGKATDTASVARFAQKLKDVKATYFADNPTLCVLVPDKSYYAKEQLPAYFDHAAIASQVTAQLPGWAVLDTAAQLTLEHYYKTDRHWRQDALFDVVASIQGKFGTAGDASAFTPRTVERFAGCYYDGKIVKTTEQMTYLESLDTSRAYVRREGETSRGRIYDLNRLKDGKGYDFFLGGASPVITISNASTTSSKKLVIIGDSFAENLAPLLTDAYGTITLVDLRYVSSDLLGDYVDFKDADVLCVFCDNIINNSLLLK